jgi:predicted RNA-binding Zn ribbon-like protein
MVKDKIHRMLETRRRLAKQLPDPSIVLAGSLMKRMIRCNKPGCRYCEKDRGRGHGPIWILSVSAGNRRVRQIPVPAHLRQETQEGVRRYGEIQKWLRQVSRVNVDLLEERKKR